MEIVIGIEDIVEVTKTGIVYETEFGEYRAISFEECKQNWIAYVNANEFRDRAGNRVHLLPGQSNCIGTHNASGTPYLLLYSNEKVKIELAYDKNTKLTKLQKELPKVLYQAGVTTFDMT